MAVHLWLEDCKAARYSNILLPEKVLLPVLTGGAGTAGCGGGGDRRLGTEKTKLVFSPNFAGGPALSYEFVMPEST